MFWLRHPRHRYNSGSWGWENDGFTRNDISEVGYHLVPLPQETTLRLTYQWIEALKKSELPNEFTIGIEIEGSLYDSDGNLIPKHDKNILIEEDQHPELINFTVETTTSPKNNSHLQTTTDIARSLAEAISEGKNIASLRRGKLVYASVPEGGKFDDGTITKHPYLLSFAPKILQFTLENWDRIPEETKVLYQQLGVDIKRYLLESNNLNWPVNALHIHNGIPQIEDLGDPRCAYTYGVLRLSLFPKLVSLILSNTRHVYGIETSLADVRSIMRRLLASTLDSTLPLNAQELIEQTIIVLANGEIHSPSRYPVSGQHDRVRFRSEKQYKTVESIDAHMNPDLRLVLMWAYFNQILNVIALDALMHVRGDESKAISYLKNEFGEIFSIIPAIGDYSSFEIDLIFNREGYNGRLLWVENKTYRQLLQMIVAIVKIYGKRYPAIQTQAKIVNHIINQHLSPKTEEITLTQYFGIEKGNYAPNGLNRGIVTNYKNIPISDIIDIQAEATLLQSVALQYIRDEKDLLAFFGIS